MDNILSKEDLSSLMDEVKGLENSILLKVTQDKINLSRNTCADMPVYNDETMAQREFFRGVVNGLEWFTKDIHTFIDNENALLQKKEK